MLVTLGSKARRGKEKERAEEEKVTLFFFLDGGRETAGMKVPPATDGSNIFFLAQNLLRLKGAELVTSVPHPTRLLPFLAPSLAENLIYLWNLDRFLFWRRHG